MAAAEASEADGVANPDDKSSKESYFSSATDLFSMFVAMGCSSGQETDLSQDETTNFPPDYPPQQLDGVPPAVDQAVDAHFSREQQGQTPSAVTTNEERAKQVDEAKQCAKTFLSEFRKALLDGFKMIKHDESGRTETYLFKLESDDETITWSSCSRDADDPPAATSVHLREIRIVSTSMCAWNLVRPSILRSHAAVGASLQGLLTIDASYLLPTEPRPYSRLFAPALLLSLSAFRNLRQLQVDQETRELIIDGLHLLFAPHRAR